MDKVLFLTCLSYPGHDNVIKTMIFKNSIILNGDLTNIHYYPFYKIDLETSKYSLEPLNINCFTTATNWIHICICVLSDAGLALMSKLTALSGLCVRAPTGICTGSYQHSEF